MITLDNILREIHNVPKNRLEELAQFVQSLIHKPKSAEGLKAKILSYNDLLADFDEDDYLEFTQNTKSIREELFERGYQL